MQKIIEFSTPLTERYRPKRVSDFIGLAKPKKILEAFIKQPFDAAFLFLGPSGVGKTTIAMAIAEQLEAETHLIPSRTCDLEAVYNLTMMCHNAAFNFKTGRTAPCHVAIIDEVDQATLAAQHSFLSILDETARPPKTIFIFTANSTANLEVRFRSRCRELRFEHESLEGELERYLKQIYKKEGGRYPLSFVDISKASGYNVRDALMKLEVEIMMGADRSDLPPEKELEIVAEHPHSCKKCSKPWKHAAPLCELPYRSDCPNCGGSNTIGQERAKKAWKTIEAKIIAKSKAAKQHKKAS